MLSQQPRRVLSIFVLAMLNVSIMASLRNLPLVAEYGLSAIFYFALVALLFLIPSALVSAELATGWPKTGGVYIWVKEALGGRWGFFAIWMQWVHNLPWYPVILGFVSTTFLRLISPELAENKLWIFLLIVGSFWAMTLLNYLGIKTSSWFSTIGVIIGTIIPGLLIICLGVSWVGMGEPMPISLSWSGVLPEWQGIGSLVFLTGMFLAFAGLEVSAVYAADVQNPQKNYPKAIWLAALITFFVFMLGSLSIAVVIPKHDISLVAGLMDAFHIFFSHYGLEWFLPVMGGLLIIGAIAEVNAWVIGPVKGLYATSIHGDLPPFFQKLNKYGMPTHILLCQAILVTLCAAIFLYMPTASASYWILSALSAQSYLIMYILMFISAIRLRYIQPHVPRSYSIPLAHRHRGMWLAALIGIASSLFAFFIGFVPPAQLNIGSLFFYDLFLGTALFLMCAVPLYIFQCRKPEWMKSAL